MSLTSIIGGKQFQELRDKFKSTFPRPDFSYKTEIIAPPLTANYSVVGQAFDYLVRFYLEHKYKNKIHSKDYWVADHSYGFIFNRVTNSKASKIRIGYRHDVEKDRKEFLKMLGTEYFDAKSNYKNYVGNGRLTDELIKSCLFLSRLDTTYRAGMIDANLGNESDLDVNDLQKLINTIDPKNFHVEKYCYINPTFGDGSFLVGGADADLIIDGTLIDLKVTKNLKLDRSHLNQILGYYILSLIGGVNEDELTRLIQKVGIYFARHGQLWKSPLSAFGNEQTLEDFKEWFTNYADKSLFGGRFSEVRKQGKELSEGNKKINSKPTKKKTANPTTKLKKTKKTAVKNKDKKKVVSKRKKNNFYSGTSHIPIGTSINSTSASCEFALTEILSVSQTPNPSR